MDFDREFRATRSTRRRWKFWMNRPWRRLLQLRHSEIRNFCFETQQGAFKFNLLQR